MIRIVVPYIKTPTLTKKLLADYIAKQLSRIGFTTEIKTTSYYKAFREHSSLHGIYSY